MELCRNCEQSEGDCFECKKLLIQEMDDPKYWGLVEMVLIKIRATNGINKASEWLQNEMLDKGFDTTLCPSNIRLLAESQ